MRQTSTATLSPTQQAILDIRSLRARLEASEQRSRAPIAIIGMACRFPGKVDNLRSYWRLLCAGTDAIDAIPADRWDERAWYDSNPDTPGKMSTRLGGFLQQVDQFDAEFFGISDREAVSIDPQQRLLLEVSWEALENAGLPAQDLFGTPTGVFIGISSFDYAQLRARLGDPSQLDAYHATGIAHSAASGRLAYYLGLQGPSLSIDTACSSSLVAVHLACQSLRASECRVALCGGVNLILSPEIHVTLSKARMMAPDGRCKAFDDRADGFVRSEGCGIIVLKKLSDALADGDHIHAVIRGSACNQDGRSSGLTAPNGPSQTAVVREAWRAAGVRADQLDYVETHGTGTALGDPIEAGALAATLQELPAQHRLSIGSVKTNLGHMEAAAGVGGLIKAVLALENEQLPPSLHFRTPNKNVDWAGSRLKVINELTAWPRTSRPRLAGVSSFGFSGTNVHVVLEEAPLRANGGERAQPERSCHLLTLSARNETALREMATRLATSLRDASDEVALADIAYTANVGRSHFIHRAAVVAASRAEAADLLDHIAPGCVDALRAPEVAFLAGADLFCPVDLHGGLYRTIPAFRAAIDQCQAADRLSERSATACFAMQWALAQTWRSWGIEPALLLGEGVGAYVAGCLAGVFTLEDGLRLADAHSQVLAGSEDPAAAHAQWLSVAQSVQYSAPRVSLFSNGRQRILKCDEVPDAQDWLQPIRLDALPGDQRMVLRLAETASERQMFECLAALYVRGVSINWKALDHGYTRRLSALPGYPWHRERYWFPGADAAMAAPSGDERWQRVVGAGDRQADQIPIDLLLHTYAEKYRALDRLATSYIVRAFQALGAFTIPGARLRASDLLDRYGVLPLYRLLMERWLLKLTNENLLQQSAGVFTAPQPLSAPPPETLETAAAALFADAPMLLEYIRNCGRLLASILTGRTSALDTLFPGGSPELAEAIYHRAALSRYFNAIAGALVGAVAQQHRGMLRILELGAGTGGTTASILPVLPPDRSDYTLTDVSEFFFSHAARRFEKAAYLKFGLLDLERSPESQGYQAGQYDIVVAANVLHATKDLGQTLDFVHRLLCADGVLVLYEVTDPPAYFDVSIALIEGWQKFSDSIRDTSPLLTTDEWMRCLLQHGFHEIVSWPGAATPAEVLGSHVFIARACARAAASPLQPLLAPTAVKSARAYATESAPQIAESFAHAPEGEQYELMIGFVRSHVAQVLRRSSQSEIPRNTRLMDLGLDSLMAVELRNHLSQGLQLKQPLPATLIFDFPCVADIATHLLSLLRAAAAPAEVPAQDPPPDCGPSDSTPRMTAALLDKLSDAEVERMLNEKLERM